MTNLSKELCEICGSKNIAMINHTEKYALCHKCMPDVVYKDGFEFKKKAIDIKDEFKHQVRTLFEEGLNDR